MCGIAGIIACDSPESGRQNLTRISHRGPDSSSFEYFHNERVFFGHVRLSIIDVGNSGSQPMHDSRNELSIVFNGEIYNYKLLKEKLLNDGVKFNTESDTEVILEMYRKYGIECVRFFKGMFAFCILDKRLQKLFFARDRFGVKPLYYQVNSEYGLVFSSEIKFIRGVCGTSRMNNRALYTYLKTGYVGNHESIYDDIRSFKPGSTAEYDIKSEMLSESYYWKPEDFYLSERITLSSEEFQQEVKRQLIDSVGLRLVADVPIGVFLSGGIDSNLVSAILKKEYNQDFQAFTVGFDDSELDESVIAAKSCAYLGVKHHRFTCNYDTFKSEFDAMYRYFDEPFGDTSAPLTMYLAKRSKEYVKVCLSADGGDELFGGYRKYYSQIPLLLQAAKIPFALRSLTSELMRKPVTGIASLKRKALYEAGINLLGARAIGDMAVASINGGFFSDYEIDSNFNLGFSSESFRKNWFLEPELEDADVFEAMTLFDVKNYMHSDILKKVDNATMAYGLEGREPFLSHTLFEWLARVAPKNKYDLEVNKKVLRDLTYTYIPKKIINQPKKGFGAPIRNWMPNLIKSNRDLIMDLRGEFGINEKYLTKLLENSQHDWQLSSKLWVILSLMKWKSLQ